MSSERIRRERRLEGIARIVPHIGQRRPNNRAEAAARLCEAVRELTGAAAAALFLDDGVLARAAACGFTLLPPDGLPNSLDGAELDKLIAWGSRRGLAPVELAPLRFEEQVLGVLALFGGPVEPLTGDDLAVLGGSAAYVLEQARTLDEQRRALETQERIQDQVVRTERLRVLGEVALGIAHDFNNVLNAMLVQVGVLELLAKEQPSLAAPIEHLKHVALDGASTVSRLQDFSRQRRDQEFAELDLTDLCRSASVMVRERVCAPLQVEERLEAAVLVAGNARELREAIDAVLENAVDAQGERIRISLERNGEEARLVIADDGAGMSKEVRKRAFDPFFTTKGSLASGLGLSVAYGIVRRHGGRIDLDSAPGQGTRVKIRLPAIGRTGASEAAARCDSARPGGVRILLVEDDDDNREAMATLLCLGGHSVIAAASGGDGVRHFAASSFDLVLTDLGLPDMTGWEVARQVKDVSSSTPVALITGWGLNLEKEEIHRRGVDLLIKKPIEPRTFLQQLAGLGRRSEGRPQLGAEAAQR
jgi:signal transduction histidine kinase/CheY-like chemotaxis protein